MAFMEPEVEFGWFDVIETSNGTVIYPNGVLSTSEILQEINSDPTYSLIMSIEEATEEGLYELVHGWFCRLNAPGYMDCTDWDGPFDTEADALEYLDDTYGDDDAED